MDYCCVILVFCLEEEHRWCHKQMPPTWRTHLCNTLRMTAPAAHSTQHTPIPPAPVAAKSNPCGIDATATQHAVAIPPTTLSTHLGARIEHISPTHAGLLSTTLAQHLAPLPPTFFVDLLRFGAIYHCPVHPPPPSCLPAADAQRVLAIRDAGLQALGRRPTNEEQVPRKLDSDCVVQPWCYLRVHLHPKRFPMAYDVDWKVLLTNTGNTQAVPPTNHRVASSCATTPLSSSTSPRV